MVFMKKMFRPSWIEEPCTTLNSERKVILFLIITLTIGKEAFVSASKGFLFLLIFSLSFPYPCSNPTFRLPWLFSWETNGAGLECLLLSC